VVDALVAYLQSLTPPPPPAVARGAVDAQAVERGRQVFAAQSCHECHMPPHYTSSVAYDVGLTDQRGENRFNPPSLRGLSQRSRYFHDNRIGSLEELLTIHPRSDVSTEPMSAAERDDLVTFLLSL
jgi:cytochrome c peroxidase